jgi:PAS domain-containing protein
LGRPSIAQHPIELILLRHWASYFSLPVFILGADGALVYYNGPAEEMLGRRFDEAGEMPVDQLSAIFQTRDEYGAPMAPESLPIGIALGERRPAHRRFQYWGLDGAWRMVETTALPISGHGGQHLGAVAIWWEVEGG